MSKQYQGEEKRSNQPGGIVLENQQDRTVSWSRELGGKKQLRNAGGGR